MYIPSNKIIGMGPPLHFKVVVLSACSRTPPCHDDIKAEPGDIWTCRGPTWPDWGGFDTRRHNNGAGHTALDRMRTREVHKPSGYWLREGCGQECGQLKGDVDRPTSFARRVKRERIKKEDREQIEQEREQCDDTKRDIETSNEGGRPIDPWPDQLCNRVFWYHVNSLRLSLPSLYPSRRCQPNERTNNNRRNERKQNLGSHRVGE